MNTNFTQIIGKCGFTSVPCRKLTWWATTIIIRFQLLLLTYSLIWLLLLVTPLIDFMITTAAVTGILRGRLLWLVWSLV